MVIRLRRGMTDIRVVVGSTGWGSSAEKASGTSVRKNTNRDTHRMYVP